MSDTLKRVSRYCDLAHIEDEDPLRAALLTVVEAAEQAKAAKTIGPKMSPEAERELVSRVTQAAYGQFSLMPRRLDRATSIAVGVIGVLLLLGGYLAGHWNSQSCSQPIQQDQKSGRHYCVVLFD